MAATGGHHGTPVPLTRDLIIGILSLLLWALILTVSVKYVFLLLRADNKGEGGSLTLVARLQRAPAPHGAGQVRLPAAAGRRQGRGRLSHPGGAPAARPRPAKPAGVDDGHG